MKLRIIKLSPEQFVTLLQGKPLPWTSSLPSDLELLDTKMDLPAHQTILVVRSDTFSDVAETMPIPELILTRTSEAKPPSVSKPFSGVLKGEPKLENKPLPVRPTPPSTSRYAAKMENEFSPNQRKLLSFTIKDDAVIVKPVTFLKTEWDDINETVRSLGGKWVKGDIISYWEIPLQ